jgi:hypothetical protein
MDKLATTDMLSPSSQQPCFNESALFSPESGDAGAAGGPALERARTPTATRLVPSLIECPTTSTTTGVLCGAAGYLMYDLPADVALLSARYSLCVWGCRVRRSQAPVCGALQEHEPDHGLRGMREVQALGEAAGAIGARVLDHSAVCLCRAVCLCSAVQCVCAVCLCSVSMQCSACTELPTQPPLNPRPSPLHRSFRCWGLAPH